MIHPYGDDPQGICGFGGENRPITFTYIKCRDERRQKELDEKMLDRRELSEPRDAILVQRLTLVVERSIGDNPKGSALTGWL